MGLSMKERDSVTKEIANRYKNARKKEKKTILNEYISLTGFNRKYAITKINSCIKRKTYVFNNKTMNSCKVEVPKRKKREYIPKYDKTFQISLIAIWSFFDYMCGQRLVPFIKENITELIKERSFKITDVIKEKLLTISSATVNRLLKEPRKKNKLHGISTTKAGASLNKLIPIRVFFDWDERVPGFFEIDTVSHDGGNASGEHIYTVTATDVSVGWTEIRPVLNKAQRWVKESIEDIKNNLPYKMLGIDSDNGSEFKNHQLYKWCEDNEITFTRGRSYKKNDNCFVEQKNDSVVRRIVGYYRFEGEAARMVMADLYEQYNKLVNFFFPSMKIISKQRVEAKVIKKYDAAKTPYCRLMESSDVSEAVKAELCRRKNSLDLQQLLEETHTLQSKLISMAQPWT